MKKHIDKYSFVFVAWFVFLIVCILTENTDAEMYKWVDENGVVHFSDSPPMGVAPDSDVEALPSSQYIEPPSTPKTDDIDDEKGALLNAKSNESSVNWYDYSSGLSRSKIDRKAAIIVFYATWCPTCKKYLQVFNDPQVINETKKFIMIKVDVDKNPSLSSEYDFDGTYVPRTFAVKPNGDILHQIYEKKEEDKYYIGTGKTTLLNLMKRINDNL